MLFAHVLDHCKIRTAVRAIQAFAHFGQDEATGFGIMADSNHRQEDCEGGGNYSRAGRGWGIGFDGLGWKGQNLCHG